MPLEDGRRQLARTVKRFLVFVCVIRASSVVFRAGRLWM
jgi:hypothetical protein